MKANQKNKDSVFTLLFKEKEKLIELYNAIEGTNYSSNTKIEINTLQNALFLDRINDLSFTIDGKLVILIEHQSTINENMPLRFLLYISRIYEKIISNKDIYRTSLIKIPTPEFIVLYNGEQRAGEFPDQMVLKLSDAFQDVSENIELELVVKVYNINKGHNQEMAGKSKTLDDYAIFIAKIRENKERGKSLEDAVKEAIEYCIKNKILVDFLQKNGSEVINMLFTEFNIDDAKEIWQEEAREEGAKQKALETAKKLLAKNMPVEEIADVTGLTIEKVNALNHQNRET